MGSAVNCPLGMRHPSESGPAGQSHALGDRITALARRCEIHEAVAWAACAEACGRAPDHHLDVAVDRSSPVPLYGLAHVDLAAFNRVVGLGVDGPANPGDVAHVMGFYRDLGQMEYRVEVAPVSAPSDLSRWLEAAGFRRTPLRMAKLVRSTAQPPKHASRLLDGIEVRVVDTDDAGVVALVNRKAWGLPRALAGWYAASVGRPGFVHHGVFEHGQLVSVGAMYISDRLAWFGFDATDPDYRGRGFQTALQVSRLSEAAERGCEYAHADIEPANTSLRNAMARGFERLYDRIVFASPESRMPSR